MTSVHVVPDCHENDDKTRTALVTTLTSLAAGFLFGSSFNEIVYEDFSIESGSSHAIASGELWQLNFLA